MDQEQKIHSEPARNASHNDAGGYDEIDLIDYIKVILRRKWLIFLVFVLAVIVAGVFSFVSPKIYRVNTILEIGYGYAEGVEGIRTIEPLTHMVEKIRLGIYIELIGARLDIPKNLKIKAENPRGTNLLIIKAESAEPKLAKTVLQEINSLILLDHQERVKVKKEPLKNDIERLRIKIISLEKEKESIRAQIKILEKIPLEEQTPASQFAYFSIKERLEVRKREIENLYLRINSLERLLKDIQSTEVVRAPLISEVPIKPRPVLNVSIAGILGIFFGTFLAFLKESLQKK